MNSLDIIRREIIELYKTNPNIHINTNMTGSKNEAKNLPAVIKGIYPRVFHIEERSCGYPRSHCPQYSDVLLNRIQIAEVNKTW